MSASDTRQRILNAAQALIESGGYARLTTKEIARVAGCAEGTLFKHFKRKEDLCLAVVRENAPVFRHVIAKVKPGSQTVAQNLEQIAVAAMEFFEKLIPLAVSLFSDVDLLTRHWQSMAVHGRGPDDVFEMLATYVREEQKLGRIRADVVPPAVAALILGPCFHRVFVRQVTGRDITTIPDQKVAETLVAVLLGGLRPREREQIQPRNPSKELPSTAGKTGVFSPTNKVDKNARRVGEKRKNLK